VNCKSVSAPTTLSRERTLNENPNVFVEEEFHDEICANDALKVFELLENKICAEADGEQNC
jgi:hypothetical protein